MAFKRSDDDAYPDESEFIIDGTSGAIGTDKEKILSVLELDKLGLKPMAWVWSW